jgi:hypothetical protein
VDVAPALHQVFRPPGGNWFLKSGRCSCVVLGRNAVFLQKRKQL